MRYPIPLPEKNGVQAVIVLLGHLSPHAVYPPHDAVETIEECRIPQHEHDSLNSPVQWSVRQIRTPEVTLQVDVYKTLLSHCNGIQIVDGSVLYDLVEPIPLHAHPVRYDRYWYRQRPFAYQVRGKDAVDIVDYVVYQFMDGAYVYAPWSILLIDLSSIYRKYQDALTELTFDPKQAFPFLFELLQTVDLNDVLVRDRLDQLFAPYLGEPRSRLWA